MGTHGNNFFARCCHALRVCNQSKPKKIKTMTSNLIARKNLFRLSQKFFSLALWSERAGITPLQKFSFAIWKKLLDTRDKLR
ncbi:hypothetical protein EBU99_14960 [bacterium]|nr:hypothetical protein [bacterium]